MSIESEIKEIASGETVELPDEFVEQLKEHEVFITKMKAAGVVIKKQEFSIPLIERIGTAAFSQ